MGGIVEVKRIIRGNDLNSYIEMVQKLVNNEWDFDRCYASSGSKDDV